MIKNNYQKELDEIIKAAKDKNLRPTLLLHSCCGPCSSYCLSYLNDFFDITVYYYNPNIEPYEEYFHRLSEQRKIIDCLNKDLHTDIKLFEGEYDHSEFLNYVKGLELEKEGGERCTKCFELRLSKTLEVASGLNFTYFGTTLTVSPHKNAVVINEIGMDIAGHGPRNLDILWLPSDFKKKEGYKTSIELSKKYGLYRQNYCGCEFARL